MSEIEKLYENANVELKRECEFYSYCPLGFGHSCESCDVDMRDDNSAYPPFTAEKQLELIKWLCKTRDFAFEGIFINDIYYLSCRQTKNINTGKYYISNVENKKFEDALAGLINVMWQDLTDAEKAEIKRILE